MKLFTDKGLETAYNNTLEAYRKLVSYAPDDKLTRYDLDKIMFALKDYMDEIESLRDRRKRETRMKARAHLKSK